MGLAITVQNALRHLAGQQQTVSISYGLQSACVLWQSCAALLLISAFTVLRQIVFDLPLFPLGVHCVAVSLMLSGLGGNLFGANDQSITICIPSAVAHSRSQLFINEYCDKGCK